jgi:hypothetical protein
MRTVLLMAMLAACAMLLATAAIAVPSHLGPTGVVATPTADVVGAKAFDVAADYVRWKDIYGEDLKAWPIRVLAGVSDRVEVGVGYTKWQDSGTDMKIVPFNAKVMLVPESMTMPAVSVGAAYGKATDVSIPSLSLTPVDVKVTTVYAVATKTLSKGEGGNGEGMKGTVRGSLGVMYNQYKDSGVVDDSATKPFVSLEFLTPDGKTTFAVEYKTKEDIASDFSDHAISSLVVRHMFTPNFWAQAGLTNAWYTVSSPDGGGHDWFVGVGYHWTPPAEEESYY